MGHGKSRRSEPIEPDELYGISKVRRDTSNATAQNTRPTLDAGRVIEILSSDNDQEPRRSSIRSQVTSRSQGTSGWLTKLKSKAILPTTGSSSTHRRESQQHTATLRSDQRDLPPPAGLDREKVWVSLKPPHSGRDKERNLSSQPSLSSSASRVPTPLSHIGTPQADRGGGLDPVMLREISTRHSETLLSEQSNDRVYEWIPRAATVRASSITGIRSETATRNSSPEPPKQNDERPESSERTRRATTIGEDWSDDQPEPTLDGTDASVIHEINVNEMLASRPGRKAELLSRGILRKPDPSYWAERQERESEVLKHMRRNLPPKRQAQERVAGRPYRHHLKWRNREVKRLLRLWFEHGNSWAQIKAIDDQMAEPQLKDRTQVDLKDKLRTIKAWMLRQEIPIPKEFGQISISPAMLQRIANTLGEI
ncbi:hypothetical protein N7448_011078 [Penicillium atrosanguineum]|nr:hypothetical protein N7448_011078 [Penicillium atrosanguineum]